MFYVPNLFLLSLYFQFTFSRLLLFWLQYVYCAFHFFLHFDINFNTIPCLHNYTVEVIILTFLSRIFSFLFTFTVNFIITIYSILTFKVFHFIPLTFPIHSIYWLNDNFLTAPHYFPFTVWHSVIVIRYQLLEFQEYI